VYQPEPDTAVLLCVAEFGCTKIELYRDRAAFDAHEAQPHTRHFLSERERLVDRVEVDWLSPMARAGVRPAS
jgi:quinol monooxygenase YgiN